MTTKHSIHCFGLLATFVFLLLTGTQAISQTLVIADHTPPIILDTSKNAFEKMHALDLPKAQNDTLNPLVNPCHYCQKENRLWYTSFDRLHQAALTCGYDFLELRFDQMFYSKNAAIVIMVYGSITKSELSIDSILYVERNKSSSVKKLITLSKSETPHPIQIIVDPTKIGFFKTNDIDIRILAEKSNDFCSFAEYNDQLQECKYSFTINNYLYRIKDDKLYSEPSVSTRNTKVLCTPVQKYFRLGFYHNGKPCNQKTVASSDPGIKISLKEHYAFSNCVIDYEVLSNSEISEMTFTANNLVHKVISYHGEKRISGSMPLGFSRNKVSLIVKVTDKNGLSSTKVLDIFTKVEKENNEIALIETTRNARNSWARQNALNETFNTISKFQGNIVSSLLEAYCLEKAQEYLLQIPDVKIGDSIPQFQLPIAGRAPFQCTASSNGNCDNYLFNATLHGQNIMTNGISISSIDIPFMQPNSQGQTITMHYNFPLGKGYFLPTCALSQNDSIGKVANLATITLCAKAQTDKETLQLLNIPFVLDNPDNNVSFTSVINYPIDIKDTLVLTYIIEFLDRTQITFFRMIATNGENDHSKKDAITNNNATLSTDTDVFLLDKKSQIIVSREHLLATSKIVTGCIFLYSTKKRATLAEGGFWTRQ